MRTEFNLGNQQQQIGTVDKCKKKEKNNHANQNAKFKETLRMHRTSLHRINLKNVQPSAIICNT